MVKKIFITNGMARCGKDTFANFMNEFIPTVKYSSIDKVKEIAKLCGWNGLKDETGRKFLCELKNLTTTYFNMPFKAIECKIEEFMHDTHSSVLLIDIREPNEIQKVVDKYGAKTILIKNDRAKNITSNEADANVFNYNYDYTIYNNGTLEEFHNKVAIFVTEYILEDDLK